MSHPTSCPSAPSGAAPSARSRPVGGGIIAHPGAEHWSALLGTVHLIAVLLLTDIIRLQATRSSVWLTTSRAFARKTALEKLISSTPFLIGEAYPDAVPRHLSLFSLPLTDGFISPFWSFLFSALPTLLLLFLVLTPYISPYNTVVSLLISLPVAALATLSAASIALVSSPSFVHVALAPVALSLSLPLLLAALADALAATRAQVLWNDVLQRRSMGRAARALAREGVEVVPSQAASVAAGAAAAGDAAPKEEEEGEDVVSNNEGQRRGHSDSEDAEDEGKGERDGLLSSSLSPTQQSSASSRRSSSSGAATIRSRAKGPSKGGASSKGHLSQAEVDSLFACVDAPPQLRPLTNDPELLRAAAMVVDAAVSVFPGVQGVAGALTGHMRSLRAEARP